MNLHGSTAAELREHYLRWRFVPLAAELLRRDGVGSVTLAFAWFWDDTLHYEVHEAFFASAGPTLGLPLEEADGALLCDAYRTISGIPYDPITRLKDDLIDAFAPFCKYPDNYEMSMAEAYPPYAVARMNNGQLQVEIVGKLQHPYLEAIPLTTPGDPPVGHAERALDGEAISDAERLLATQGDTQLIHAIEVASILLRSVTAHLNQTVNDLKTDQRILRWLQTLGDPG